MQTFEAQSIEIHGHQVVYRMAGPPVSDGAPVLLLIHGMAGSSETWREVAPALGREYTVIAPDLLGHGGSAKPRHDYSLGAFASSLRDLMVALGVERATIVGQSLGGGVAMQFAYQFPERCERLVLVNAGGLGAEVSWMLRLLAAPGVDLVMPVLFPGFVRDAGNAVWRFIGGLGIRAPHFEEEWRGYASLTDPETRQAFLGTLRSVVDVSGQRVSAHDRLYLAEHLPTLIVWGDADRIIPVDHGYATHEAIPGSELVVFDGVGHFPHVEVPMRFVDVLTDFLARNEPAHLDPKDWQDRLLGRVPAA